MHTLHVPQMLAVVTQIKKGFRFFINIILLVSYTYTKISKSITPHSHLLPPDPPLVLNTLPQHPIRHAKQVGDPVSGWCAGCLLNDVCLTLHGAHGGYPKRHCLPRSGPRSPSAYLTCVWWNPVHTGTVRPWGGWVRGESVFTELFEPVHTRGLLINSIVD